MAVARARLASIAGESLAALSNYCLRYRYKFVAADMVKFRHAFFRIGSEVCTRSTETSNVPWCAVIQAEYVRVSRIKDLRASGAHGIAHSTVCVREHRRSTMRPPIDRP